MRVEKPRLDSSASGALARLPLSRFANRVVKVETEQPAVVLNRVRLAQVAEWLTDQRQGGNATQ